VDFVLRRATSDDAREGAALYVASWNEALARLMPPRGLNQQQIERWERELDGGPMQWWVAERRHCVIGFAGTGPSRDPIDPDLAELDTIAGAPPAWWHGVGRRLMDVALAGLRDAGYRQAILWTAANYEQGRSFYETAGWHASGEVRDAGRHIAFRRALA
jgi:N-acetylglutamate synthase-like GNAT family acetyltransferase